MSKRKQIGYSLIVWETLKEYNKDTKWFEPVKNKRIEVAQELSEELSDNEEIKSMLLDEMFNYKDRIKEMLKNGEYTDLPDYHKEELEKDKKIADHDKQVRKQVCEKIRKELNMKPITCMPYTAYNVHYDILDKILDQIEKGE